jgi:hypothetical protein
MKNVQKQVIINSLRIFKYTLRFLLLIFLVILPLIPVIFNFIYGDEIINNSMASFFVNTTDPDEKALAIMAWEKQYFYNPYSLYNTNLTMQKFGIYNVNGDYRWFGTRPAPISWIIYSRLANCEEYARVFVTMMNKEGIESRLVAAPGEDHVWAEYVHDGYEIAVDPSQNIVIGSHKKEFEKEMNVKFSYIEAVDLQGNKVDVSDEYIKRGNLTIFVFENNQSINNAMVIIRNPYLMDNRGGRYNRPIPIISKMTESKGNASFKLGNQKYIVEARVNHMYLLDTVYRRNVTVEVNKESSLNFNLENDTKSLELFITRYI